MDHLATATALGLLRTGTYVRMYVCMYALRTVRSRSVALGVCCLGLESDSLRAVILKAVSGPSLLVPKLLGYNEPPD